MSTYSIGYRNGGDYAFNCVTPGLIDALCARSNIRNIWLHPVHAHDVYEYLREQRANPGTLQSSRMPDDELDFHWLGTRYGVGIFWDKHDGFFDYDPDGSTCNVVVEYTDGSVDAYARFDATPATD